MYLTLTLLSLVSIVFNDGAIGQCTAECDEEVHKTYVVLRLCQCTGGNVPLIVVDEGKLVAVVVLVVSFRGPRRPRDYKL